MSSKHTPGPWIIDPNFLCEVQTADNKTIASCWESRDAGSHIEVTGTLECSEEESIANARLIAAAPELLSSLSEKVNDAEQACFEEWLERELPSGDHDEVQRKWRNSSDYKDFFVEWGEQIAAIAKATGEPACAI